MEYTCTKFVVDSSSRLPFTGRTPRFTDASLSHAPAKPALDNVRCVIAVKLLNGLPSQRNVFSSKSIIDGVLTGRSLSRETARMSLTPGVSPPVELWPRRNLSSTSGEQ